MSMLDRYKKKGGFVQLVTLIESSEKKKQEQFLSLIAQENAVWESTLREKCLTIDKILSWDQSHLREIFSRLQPLTLATALNGMPKDKVEMLLDCMTMTDKRKIQQGVDEAVPTPAAVSSCIMKIIAETRGFINSGILKVEKIDERLVIQDNIEEWLATEAINVSLANLSAPKVEMKVVTESPSAAAVPISGGKSEGRTEQLKEEIEFLKKRVNQLVAENTTLKQEAALFRSKLDQIRKIA